MQIFQLMTEGEDALQGHAYMWNRASVARTASSAQTCQVAPEMLKSEGWGWKSWSVEDAEVWLDAGLWLLCSWEHPLSGGWFLVDDHHRHHSSSVKRVHFYILLRQENFSQTNHLHQVLPLCALYPFSTGLFVPFVGFLGTLISHTS